MYAYDIKIVVSFSLRSMKICCMQTSGFFHVQTCTLFHLHFNHIKQHELDLLQFSWQQNQYDRNDTIAMTLPRKKESLYIPDCLTFQTFISFTIIT